MCVMAQLQLRKFFDINSRKSDEVSESDSSDEHVETPSVKRQKVSSTKESFT